MSSPRSQQPTGRRMPPSVRDARRRAREARRNRTPSPAARTPQARRRILSPRSQHRARHDREDRTEDGRTEGAKEDDDTVADTTLTPSKQLPALHF